MTNVQLPTTMQIRKARGGIRLSKQLPSEVAVVIDYTKLADDLALVLTTGPQAQARLAAIPEPWADEPLPAPLPADKPAPTVAPTAATPAPVPAPQTAATPAPLPAAPSAPLPERSEATAEPSADLPADQPADQPADKGYSLIDHMDDPPEVETMGQWILRQQSEARVPFQPWEEIISRIKAKEFHTQQALALAYNKPDKWARDLRAVAVKQGMFKNDAEWWSCFPKKLKDGSTKPSTYNPQLTAHRSAGTPVQLQREDFERVLRDKQPDGGLTFDLFVQLIKLRCWARAEDLGAHFRQPPAWTTALRTFLLRQGTFTAESWAASFGKDNKK